MNPSQTPEVFHQEIAELEAKLAAKKQELIQSGVESPEATVFKQVVREHVAPSELATPTAPVSTTTTTTATRPLTDTEQQRLNELVAHAFTKGLAAAISEARATGDAYFVDLLHDRLADEYYQKLVAARKVNPT